MLPTILLTFKYITSELKAIRQHPKRRNQTLICRLAREKQLLNPRKSEVAFKNLVNGFRTIGGIKFSCTHFNEDNVFYNFLSVSSSNVAPHGVFKVRKGLR
ncbi:hypothetical protein L596_007033 [Steinernema carpocapsae]|uniref:Uncharacterized protein n=1 Tax=Steinernema carpocapsae TaxID=34508 RepID=A0A4U5P8R1_STECR|nr:hypothetical protein L596_007033 [Steinernema carpocapsae]